MIFGEPIVAVDRHVIEFRNFYCEQYNGISIHLSAKSEEENRFFPEEIKILNNFNIKNIYTKSLEICGGRPYKFNNQNFHISEYLILRGESKGIKNANFYSPKTLIIGDSVIKNMKDNYLETKALGLSTENKIEIDYKKWRERNNINCAYIYLCYPINVRSFKKYYPVELAVELLERGLGNNFAFPYQLEDEDVKYYMLCEKKNKHILNKVHHKIDDLYFGETTFFE